MEHDFVLYRKYRPQTFSEVLGQDHIVKILKNAILQKKAAHAYLFCGPRGTGKTSIARILSKAINCDESQKNNGDPCNKCKSCLEINSQRALDIVEIDAASNTGVDNIRDLIDGIKFNPTQLKYKIFIIDEVHMLSKGAFNALLKTLEEPPSHAIFILATTEPEKVPETILSRVQRLDVKRIFQDKIIEKLKKIVKSEKANIEEDALKIIAQLAEGGMRDAESILTRILSTPDKKITVSDVESIAGFTNFSKVSKFVDLFSEKNVAGVVMYLNTLRDEGSDMHDFLKATTKYFRNLLMFQLDERLRGIVAPELTDEQFKYMMDQTKNISSKELKKLLTEFLDSEELVKKTSIPLLPIELAVMKVIG